MRFAGTKNPNAAQRIALHRIWKISKSLT